MRSWEFDQKLRSAERMGYVDLKPKPRRSSLSLNPPERPKMQKHFFLQKEALSEKM